MYLKTRTLLVKNRHPSTETRVQHVANQPRTYTKSIIKIINYQIDF